eukprot:CAMPEP_0119326110 /NCGR_PEP_ID=MMETSP1333-20130426/67491_1 /TAXON_ID=418940 /ORGANISM="Scyphosphaera apsteinii, Strain RCC1455" /LENGTH=268 /DNA_ID=CAMNT_0007334311 /DNA_START=90 /DNA_END=892 /DNA_ORIENTATION=-
MDCEQASRTTALRAEAAEFQPAGDAEAYTCGYSDGTICSNVLPPGTQLLGLSFQLPFGELVLNGAKWYDARSENFMSQYAGQHVAVRIGQTNWNHGDSWSERLLAMYGAEQVFRLQQPPAEVRCRRGDLAGVVTVGRTMHALEWRAEMATGSHAPEVELENGSLLSWAALQTKYVTELFDPCWFEEGIPSSPTSSQVWHCAVPYPVGLIRSGLALSCSQPYVHMPVLIDDPAGAQMHEAEVKSDAIAQVSRLYVRASGGGGGSGSNGG